MSDSEGAAIRDNLERLGLQDFTARGVLLGDNDTIIGEATLPVSELCALRARGLARKIGITNTVPTVITVMDTNNRLGYVSSDGVFCYEGGTVREAVGWFAATDAGREGPLVSCRLDEMVRGLTTVIKVHGVSEASFFSIYMEKVERLLRPHSRYGDGWSAAVPVIWRAATRELGQEHPGYPYSW